jgi:protoheme IX farnesyltransferase
VKIGTTTADSKLQATSPQLPIPDSPISGRPRKLGSGSWALDVERVADYVALTKPRLNLLVLVTTWAGLYLGSPTGVPTSLLVHTLLGTALVAGGAAALNQAWERRTDALMRRTRVRPLPAGRLTASEGTWFGIALSTVGLVELSFGVNIVAAAVAAATLISYVLVYTPLKVRTSLSTLVGAVPGALPSVIGWAAATRGISIEALVLFGIVFFWQMPHFLAIAWMFRDDYARAGIPLLPVLEPDGRRTGQQALIYTAALWPVSLLPVALGLAGMPYLLVATGLGLLFIWLAIRFANQRSMATARTLFLFSITYLPLLLAALVANRLWI